jgi:serine/threonine-protein kinase
MGADRLIGRRLGGFEIVDALGHGGFATVYRARQVRLGRDVALKVLDPVLARTGDIARRFEREGWAAAGLDHPAIVPVYEAGEEDGHWYLAMRLIDGMSLAEHLATRVPLTARETVALLTSVAAALDHAHERGLLHRDVKPANIMLEGERVFLGDFGIAATAQSVGNYTVGAIGTGSYMAPEQARPDEGAQVASDLYSLGCVAFECITGGVPFAAPDLVSLLYAHAHDPVPSTGDANLDAFFARALAKDPAGRFPTGASFIAGLELVAAAEPAPVTRAAPRSGSPSRVALAAAAVGVVVLLAGAGSRLLGGGGSARAASASGPATVIDPSGSRFKLRPGWKVTSTVKRGLDTSTSIAAGELIAVTVDSFGGITQGVSAFAASRSDVACPADRQTSSSFGDGAVTAVTCTEGGAVTYYAGSGARIVRVHVATGVPARDRNAFVTSFELPT